MRKRRFLPLFVLFLFPLLSVFLGTESSVPAVEVTRRAQGDDFTLVVGMEANYSPFNWSETTNDPDNNVPLQGQSGHYAAGYDVEVAKYICEDNNWELQIVQLEWDALIPSLQNGTINAIIAGMSDTQERRQSIDFSDPYYTSELVIIARNNDDRFYDDWDPTTSSGIRFVTQLGTVEDDIAQAWAEDYGAVYVNPTSDYPMAFQYLEETSGNSLADAVICEYPVAVSMMASYPDLKMVTVDESLVDSSFIDMLSVSIGIGRNDPLGIADQINASLSKLDDAERRNFMDIAIQRASEVSNSEEIDNRVGYLLSEYGIDFAYGTLNTLILAIVGTVVGLLIGIGVSQIRNLKSEPSDNILVKILKYVARFIAWIYETFFRATPMMIQAMIFFLVGPAIGIIWTNMNPGGDIGRVFNGYMLCGLIVICINTGAYMTEIVKSGLNGVDRGQEEAARSLGLSKTRTMFGVLLPQALRNCLPTIGNELIVNIKDSSVLNVIGLTELYMTASIATNTNYFRIEGYIIICLIYLVLVLVFSGILKLIANKMDMKEDINIFGFRRGGLRRLKLRFASKKKNIDVLTSGLEGGEENE